MEDHVEIRSSDELREVLGPVTEPAKSKVRRNLHDIDVEWISASPFCLIATSDRNGNCDVSPKGDPPGFSRVESRSSILIPDRPGNRRADGLNNILETGKIGLIYFIPGRGDTLRINGSARILKDCPAFDEMIAGGHRPSLGLLVEVHEVFYHCSKAFLRSKLWDPDSWQPDDVLSRASISKALERKDHSLAELEDYYGEKYGERLY
ncbi:MAG: MSMEG_1061 family FMN-dependent PPOX-type flavoprotein [Verrucomicrobiales bacterium]